MSELLTGCLLAIALRRWPMLVAEHARLWRAGALAAATFLVGFGFVGSYDPPWLLRGGYAVVAVASGMVILGVLSHGTMARVLSNRAVVRVGLMSYSIYVVHWPVVLMVNNHFADLGRWTSVLVKIALAFVAAAVVHVFIEQPLRHARSAPSTTVLLWLLACGVTTVTAAVVLG